MRPNCWSSQQPLYVQPTGREVATPTAEVDVVGVATLVVIDTEPVGAGPNDQILIRSGPPQISTAEPAQAIVHEPAAANAPVFDMALSQ